MKTPDETLRQLAVEQSPEQRLAAAERRIKQLEAEIIEYVRVEAVLIAGRKVNEDTVRKAHELVRDLD